MCVFFPEVFLDPTFVKQERQSLNIDMFILVLILGGGFKYFLVSPRFLGKLPILTNIFFQLQCFNHQLEHHVLPLYFGFIGFKVQTFVVTEIHDSP